MAGQLDFVPELVGSYWRTYRGKGVQLDVVAATPRQKRLLIGEAKWGRQTLGRSLLPDLIKRSQRMPQVAAGWQTQYALFTREGFTPALQQEAGATNALLEYGVAAKISCEAGVVTPALEHIVEANTLLSGLCRGRDDSQ
jgi:hypothetical protein